MGKQPTGSGGEPSSPNCETSAEVRLVNFAYDSACLTRGLAPKRTTPQHKSILTRFRAHSAPSRADLRLHGSGCCRTCPANPAPRHRDRTAARPVAPQRQRTLAPYSIKKRADRARNKPVCTTKTVQIPNPRAPTALFLFTPPGSAGYRAPPAHPLQSRRSAGSRRWAPPSRSFRRRRTPQAVPGTSGPRTRPSRPRRRPC